MTYDTLESLPEYAKEFTDHRIAMSEAGEDEAAKLRAQLAWSEKKAEFEQKRVAHNEAERNMNTARESVKTEYPDVPDSIYAGATTPDQMKQVAKEFDDALKAKLSASAPATGAPAGQPPTGVGATDTPSEQWQVRHNDLVDKFNSGARSASNPDGITHREVEELQQIRIDRMMAPLAQRVRQEAGNRR